MLSACETAVSDSGPYGPESLAGLVQAKGARRVLGTLWPVADDSAAALMTAFYAEAFHPYAPEPEFAEALRRAQLLIMMDRQPSDSRAKTRGLALSAGGRWAHPYHWAGYSLFEPGI